MSASTSRDTGTTGSRPEKRVRPPKLSLGVGSLRSTVSDSVTVETVASLVDITDDAEDWERRLSSPSLSSTSSSPVGDWLSIGSDSDFEANSDDLSKNLEILEKLGKHVHKNLRLRPLRSATASPDSPVSLTHFTGLIRSSRSAQNLSHSPESIADSAPSPALSIYYTPTTEFGESPLSAHYIGKDFPQNTGAQRGLNPDRSRSPAVNTFTTRRSPLPPRGIDADELFKRLASSRRPLLIDTRPPPSFLQSRIRHSLNIAIPSLIMRRCTKQGGGFASLDILRTYITTDKGKELWDGYMRRTGRWDGNIVVYDEEMNEKNQDNLQVLAWAMLVLLQPLLEKGSVEFLKGGISAARGHPSSHQYIISGERDLSAESRLDVRADDTSPRKGGLFQLDTQTASRSKAMPEIERPTSSPGPLVSSSNHNMLCDLSPSPSPSISTFPHHMKGRKGSAPSLGRIDTSSAERLVPKLTVRTVPVKSNTLSVAPSMSRHSSSSSLRPNSPRHLNLLYSNKTGSGLFPPSANSSSESLSPYIHQATSPAPRSPTTPMGFPPSPVTARPDLEQPPTTEEPLPVFSVSTILPNFLFLGPELTSHEHVRELQSLGIKRILNIAIECDDDQGLRLREKFERYTRIPMRDTVEEENVAHSVHEACEALDDARLHSAPTYVHCKAGKSRSVTAVIAYLIHANHWTLSRAYAFVLERRKGISPNIGFVSELMIFEEQELGGKSVGVVKNSGSPNPDADDYGGGKSGNFGYMVGGRRTANLRESLPPILAGQSEMIIPGQLSAGGLSSTSIARVGDSGQEMEIKDSSGRYRHARRAPVDENTLQPMRRVSKAGLESSSYSSIDV